MIWGILSSLAGNVAVTLWALVLLRRFRTGTEVDWPLLLTIRLTMISIAMIVAGLCHALTSTGLAIASLGALVILWASRAYRSWPSLPRIQAGRIALLFSAIIAIRLLWQVATFSPHVPDVLTYHLPKVAEWVRAGGFTRELGVDERASFPAGFELIETWWVVFFHHDALIEMAGIEFLFLAFVSVYSLARTLGVETRAAFLGGLIAILTPGLHFQATSCLNDGPVAALYLAAAAFIAAPIPLPLVLCAIGLGIGVKPTFAYALPGLALLWLLLRREAKIAPRSTASTVLAFTALAVGAFWYFRNWIWYGNPIHPMGVAGFLGPTGRPSQQFGPSLDSLTHNVTCLIDIRLADRGPLGSMLDGTAGWGAASVACGLPALVLALRNDARWRRLALSFGVSAASVLLLVSLDRWYLRFVLFFPAILALATARLAESAREILPVCAAALLLQFAGTFYPKEMAERPRLTMPSRLDPVEPVACFADREGYAYLLYGADYSRPILYLRANSASELIEKARRSSARVLLAAPALRRDWETLRDAVATGELRPLDGSFYLVSR